MLSSRTSIYLQRLSTLKDEGKLPGKESLSAARVSITDPAVANRNRMSRLSTDIEGIDMAPDAQLPGSAGFASYPDPLAPSRSRPLSAKTDDSGEQKGKRQSGGRGSISGNPLATAAAAGAAAAFSPAPQSHAHGGSDLPMEIFYHVHTDWVTQLRYEDEMHCIISCSLDGTVVVRASRALAGVACASGAHVGSSPVPPQLFDVESRTVRFRYGGHKLGVKGLVYCSSLGICASYGLEREIHLWLLKSGVKVGVLEGFTSSLQCCVVNQARQQLVSLTVDQTVKLWDLKEQKSLFTLKAEQFPTPEDRKVTFLCFDEERQRLLTLYNRPVRISFLPLEPRSAAWLMVSP